MCHLSSLFSPSQFACENEFQSERKNNNNGGTRAHAHTNANRCFDQIIIIIFQFQFDSRSRNGGRKKAAIKKINMHSIKWCLIY